jgi:YgiT-type zinc finger domain-containing protein
MERTSRDLMAEVERGLQSWRSIHPHATFAEIEAAVEKQVYRLRAHLVQETVEEGFVEEAPGCPRCGQTMRPRSRTARHVVLQGDATVHLERPYVVCPACGLGLFPPG